MSPKKGHNKTSFGNQVGKGFSIIVVEAEEHYAVSVKMGPM